MMSTVPRTVRIFFLIRSMRIALCQETRFTIMEMANVVTVNRRNTAFKCHIKMVDVRALAFILSRRPFVVGIRRHRVFYHPALFRTKLPQVHAGRRTVVRAKRMVMVSVDGQSALEIRVLVDTADPQRLDRVFGH